MSKRFTFLILLLIFFLSFSAAFGIYYWLYSIQANTTLKTAVPAIFFIVTFLGLWLLFNFIKLFFFQKKGIRGYKLRGRITAYFLLTTLGFILVFGTMMFTLILLIENIFIDRERKVADNLLNSYQNMINMNKKEYELNMNYLLNNESGKFPVVFIIHKNTIIFKKSDIDDIRKNIQESGENIINYFSDLKEKYFYLGEIPKIIIVKKGGEYYAELMPRELTEAFINLKNISDTLYQLRFLKQYILPVSVLSISMLTVPILIGVFFVSLYVAKNITVPIEAIANGTKIIAGGNLDYKVQVHTHDEIGDLAYHFNSMATKLKTAYKQIKRMERLEAWQEMARKLAHEVKNPLTPIKLSAERLLYAYDTKPGEFKEILNKTTSTIINETKRLENLVNEYSQFARLPNPKMEKKDIISILNDTMDFFQGAYPDFKIIRKMEPEESFLTIDENQIRQVIINLVNNAIEASDNMEKVVTVAARPLENNFIISIADKGKGIPKDIQEKMFEPYLTTKQNGSGIGLAIAERIVLEHNGNLWFETGEKGTVFYIQLPG